LYIVYIAYFEEFMYQNIFFIFLEWVAFTHMKLWILFEFSLSSLNSVDFFRMCDN